MEKYVVLNDEGVTLADVVHAKGAVIDLDPENEHTISSVEAGLIAPVEVLDDDKLEDFVVTEAFLEENPLMASEAGIKVGDTIRVPKVVPEETATVAAPVQEEVAPVQEEEVKADAEPVMTHAGKVVVRAGVRTVNGREIHEVTLEDGSSLDLTDEEYDQMVENAK